MNVNIYIETSFRGPATRRAAGAWIVEYISSTGRPVTRGGILYSDKTTENELALQLIRKAFSILTKTCCAVVFTECGHVLRTMDHKQQSDVMKTVQHLTTVNMKLNPDTLHLEPVMENGAERQVWEMMRTLEKSRRQQERKI